VGSLDHPPGASAGPRDSFAQRDVAAYCTRVPLEPGLAAAVSLLVAEDDTALALRSGDVPVLATPRLIALCEEASLQAVAAAVPDGHTTVGMRVQLDHLVPTAIGAEVTAEATLEKVEGRRLTFTVSASDERGLVAAGKVTRVVVDVERFLEKCL
jgi:fluoroacetyl-CoA thioesterase